MPDIRVDPSGGEINQAWDAFLDSTPGASHVQSSLWGRVKASIGQDVVRVIAYDGTKVIGGAQVTIVEVPVFGKVGFVPRGPSLAADHADLLPALLDEVRSAAWASGIRHLTIQPPMGEYHQERQLDASGFTRTNQEFVPAATTTLDLSHTLDDLLAAMHKKTRYNIRLAERRGVVVRVGDSRDLDTFCSFVEATGNRQGFQPYPSDFYRTMFTTLDAAGHARLAVAEIDGEPLSASLSIPFSDTLLAKLTVWGGERGDLHPNEACHWEAITEAKNRDLVRYDLEGINLRAAQARLAGDDLPEDLRDSVAKFKLAFGGDVVVFPNAYFDAANPIVKWGYRNVVPRLSSMQTFQSMRQRLRTRSAPQTTAGRS